MIRVVRCALVASRALVPLTRLCLTRPAPLTTRYLSTLTPGPHRSLATAEANVEQPTPPVTGESVGGRGWSSRRRQLRPQAKTRDSVINQFEGLLSQPNAGGGLSPAGYEVLKSCVNPYLLEPPATKITMATEMVSMLKEKGVSVDVGIYNTLLRIYVSLGHSFTPSQLLTEMQECGVEPNFGTLTYLIEAYCQQGNMTGAAKLLEHLSASESAITEDIYASLITGHAQNGNLSEAEGVLKLMRDKGHPPGNAAYQALRCAYAQHGDQGGLSKVREEMRKDRVFASTASTIRVIDTLSRYNHSHMIQETLDHIRRKQWMLEDLRALACTLLLRGEVEGGLVVVRCLGSYSAVTTLLGRAVVRGTVLAQQPLGEVLNMIGQFPAMSSNQDPVNMWIVYRELLGMIYEEKISSGDQKAEDIMTVATAMRELGDGEWFLEKSFLYPVLAHYSETGNIEGCMKALQLTTAVIQSYDFYSMKFLAKALVTAGVSPAEFLENYVLSKRSPKTEKLVSNLMIYFSETGDFSHLSQSLRTLSSSEGVKVGVILRGLSLTVKKNYKPGCLADLAQVYIALHNLEPRPSLDKSVTMTIHDILSNGPKGDQDSLYESLLSPLTQAGIPIGQAHNELLTSLAERGEVVQLIKIYNELKDLEQVHLSPGVHQYVAMASQKSRKVKGQNLFQELKLQKPLSLDLARYDELTAGGHMPQYLHCEELVLSLVNSDLEAALRIRDAMVAHGYKLRFGVYEKLIECYAQQGDVQNMLAEVEALEKSGLFPNPAIFTDMMLGYSLQGEPDEVRRLLGEVVKRNRRVNGIMTAHLLLAYINSGQLSEALQVLSEYVGFATPRAHALKALLNELVKQGRPQDEIGTVIAALHSLPTLTAPSVSDIALRVYLDNGRLSDAREVIKREDFELKPPAFISHCRQWKAAGRTDLLSQVADLLREAELHKQSADNAFVVLSIYNLLNDKKGALSLAEDLHNNGCDTDTRFTQVLKRMRIVLSTDIHPSHSEQ